MNREQLIREYVEVIIDGMDMTDLVQYATDVMTARLEHYTDEELRDEIETFHPVLLDEE